MSCSAYRYVFLLHFSYNLFDSDNSVIIILLSMERDVNKSPASRKSKVSMNLQAKLIQSWNQHNIPQFYQNLFIAHLKKLPVDEADIAIKEQIKAIISQISYIQHYDKCMRERKKIEEFLKTQIKIQENTQNEEKLPMICDYVRRLREINYKLAYYLEKIRNKYEANIYIHQSIQKYFYSQFAIHLDSFRKELLRSKLGKYVRWHQSYDPFYLGANQKQIANIDKKLQQALATLFDFGVEESHKYLKMKKILMTWIYMDPKKKQPIQKNSKILPELQDSRYFEYDQIKNELFKQRSQDMQRSKEQPIIIIPSKTQQEPLSQTLWDQLRSDLATIEQINLNKKYWNTPQAKSKQPQNREEWKFDKMNGYSRSKQSFVDSPFSGAKTIDYPVTNLRRSINQVGKIKRRIIPGKSNNSVWNAGQQRKPTLFRSYTVNSQIQQKYSRNITSPKNKSNDRSLPVIKQTKSSQTDIFNLTFKRPRLNLQKKLLINIEILPIGNKNTKIFSNNPIDTQYSTTEKHRNNVNFKGEVNTPSTIRNVDERDKSEEQQKLKAKEVRNPTVSQSQINIVTNSQQKDSQAVRNQEVKANQKKSGQTVIKDKIQNINNKTQMKIDEKYEKYQQKSNKQTNLEKPIKMVNQNQNIVKVSKDQQNQKYKIQQTSTQMNQNTTQINKNEQMKQPTKKYSQISNYTSDNKASYIKSNNQNSVIAENKNNPTKQLSKRSNSNNRNNSANNVLNSKQSINQPQQANSLKAQRKQIKIKVGKLTLQSLQQYLNSYDFDSKYKQLIDLPKLIKEIQYSQTYLTQFICNEQPAAIALSSLTPPNNIIVIRLWAMASKYDQNMADNLFKKYADYLQKNISSQSIYFKGENIEELQKNGFQMKKQKLYARTRTTQPKNVESEFQPFVYIECSHINFQQKQKQTLLYSQQIQQFNGNNAFAAEYLFTITKQLIPQTLKKLIKISQKLPNFVAVNKILTAQNFDNFETNQKMKIQYIDLLRVSFQSQLRDTFIAGDGFFKFYGTEVLNSQKKNINCIKITKNNSRMCFGKGFNSIQQFVKSLKAQTQKRISFCVPMFSKKLYGRYTKLAQNEKGYYGNWQISLVWEDEMQGRVKHSMKNGLVYGDTNFYVSVEIEGIFLYAFEVSKEDYVF